MTGSTTVRRLLVANRGEIARRVFATCRRLGIETVAVHSDADAHLPFVREADFAVRLPGNTPAETYLRTGLVIDAARSAGADAIHPGYGFLSENASFGRAVLEAGLTWVGPDPDSIDAMGSKIEAKKLMADAGVPVFTELAQSAVTEADLPVLVKASAGGGGRGMRIVRSLDALPDEVAKAESEAASAFGDGTVFIEPYLEHGRHIEVQVVGDRHGGVLILGERDCSLQRRHQKVIEESPAPGISESVRSTLHEAARNAAEAIGYVGAGTVEFMVSTGSSQGSGKISFLEMNTRLQVEHPVTEAVFGIDLVEAQIAVAEGASVHDLRSRRDPDGHAIEVRLYAEDPAADYQPQSGRLETFAIPGVDVEFGQLSQAGLRLDSGFETGNEVGTHYDAMLAKLISWAPTREQAARRLAGALRRARIHGVRTNRDLLVEVLTHDAFLAGDLSTDFLPEQALLSTEARAAPGTSGQRALMFFAAAVAVTEEVAARRPVQRGVPNGWRNVVSAPQTTAFDLDGTRVDLGWHSGRDGYRLAHVEEEAHDARALSVTSGPEGWRVTVEQDQVTYPFEVAIHDLHVDVDSALGHLALTLLPRFVDPADVVAQGSLLAPMPGTVIGVRLEVGAEVTAGQTVLVVEAMKMQHTISAPTDGVLTELTVAVGSQVASGDVLAVVTPPGQADQTTQDHEGDEQ
jgi:propionyl-CoA carboxylase alpha chain